MLTSFAILTLGCKVNQYESQQIRQFLEGRGLTQVPITARPQLVIVNTCCVTHTASAKSRRFIHLARNQHPEAVVICGCLTAVHTDELRAAGENLLVVNDRRDLTATLHVLVAHRATTPDAKSSRNYNTFIKPHGDPKVKPKNDLRPPQELPPLTSFQGQTRAFLKVQDGCDCSCSYCIIPTARPLVRYKPVDEILAEAAALVAAGHKEIVLTGVNIGAYGYTTARRRHWPDPENKHLPEMLAKVAQIPGLARIRVSSLDPADVTPALLDVFAAHRNIMPHLHLSLQSGSDNILRRMARPYTADDFRNKVALARRYLDRPAITTDIIVGFPTETDADFAETLALAKEVAFAKMHVFAYSARQGTPAARMHPKVPPEVKKHRSRLLRDLDATLQSQFRAQFIGETAQVLIETLSPTPTGRAERYFEVQVVHGSHPCHESHKSHSRGELVTVKLEENARDTMLATAVQ
jgi:threonylcarbamoyladenosine tRNA methylthiotransferase MtaB